jgi:hypothetical protein
MPVSVDCGRTICIFKLNVDWERVDAFDDQQVGGGKTHGKNSKRGMGQGFDSSRSSCHHMSCGAGEHGLVSSFLTFFFLLQVWLLVITTEPMWRRSLSEFLETFWRCISPWSSGSPSKLGSPMQLRWYHRLPRNHGEREILWLLVWLLYFRDCCCHGLHPLDDWSRTKIPEPPVHFVVYYEWSES